MDRPAAGCAEWWITVGVVPSAQNPDSASKKLLQSTRVAAEHVLDAEEGEPTYRAGMDFVSLAVGAMSSDVSDTTAANDMPMGIYVVWGALTDEWDAPGRGPAERGAAVQRMKRAALEWRSAVESPRDTAPYLDRWVYEECGYKRPD
jgi:hypothetical protein